MGVFGKGGCGVCQCKVSGEGGCVSVGACPGCVSVREKWVCQCVC
jgi:hypothetical protein